MSDILNNIELLESLTGISKEAFQVYKQILINPPDNLSLFAKKVSFSRGKLYKTLSELEFQKLIYKPLHHSQNFKYLAVDPNLLLEKINNKKKDLDKDIAAFKQHILFLKSLESGKDRSEPTMQIIRGKNTNDQLDKLIISKGKPVSGFSYVYHLDACFDFDKNGNLVSNDYLDLVLSVTDKFVFPGNDENLPKIKKFLKQNPILIKKWMPRWIPKEEFDFKINFYCFDDSVAFSLGKYNEKDYQAYIINNKEISYSMKQIAKYAWNHANEI